MLKTGTVPVSDQIQRVPAAPQDSKSHLRATRRPHKLMIGNSQGQDAGCGTGGRRRGRAAEAASRDGHVSSLGWRGEQIQCQQDTTRACLQTFGLVTGLDKEIVQSRWARRTAFGDPFRDWRWRTGGCIRDCEGIKGTGWRQPAIQFPNHIESLPYSLLIRA